MTTGLRWLPLVSAVLLLVGTALIVWGLKVAKEKPGVRRLLLDPSDEPSPSAAILRDHPWAVNLGVWLLLVGLALQVVAALR